MAQPVPDYGQEWRTIGAAGNAAATQSQFQLLDRPVGAVNYEFRMARTEVTNAQYLDFLIALNDVVPQPQNLVVAMCGAEITRSGTAGSYTWTIWSGAHNMGATMGWHYAAMYCNWLHNDQRRDAAAFLSGAYDVSTYWPNPGPPQLTHSPGARFWLPSRDEWTKAMHYDPNKNGPGQGGYWMFPTSSDTLPVGGPPGTPGAQTGAGEYDAAPNYARIYDVGSYPLTQSPWGLLDGSGGQREWCEGDGNFEVLGIRGSRNLDDSIDLHDPLDRYRYGVFYGPDAGIRLASMVPAPGVAFTLAGGIAAVVVRRRR
jgi:hypothetical protein